MRSLVVTRWVPWPPTSGARNRSATIVAGLTELGDVDVLVVSQHAAAGPIVTPPRVRLLGVVPRTATVVGRRARLGTLVPGALPAALRVADHGPVRRAWASLPPQRYDLAWFVRIESWLALGRVVDAPAVVDYDDLHDGLLRSRRSSGWATHPRLRRQLLSDAVEARAWARVQRLVAREVAAVTVCSELDRRRLGIDNAEVVPNGVPLPSRPERRPAGRPPTILLHGSLDYRPNAEAAALLVHDVLPLVRAAVPDVEVRIVGRHDRRVAALASAPGVVVTGFVDDIADELARADVVAVPLLEGAGTRVKILEALAHAVPVVSTPLGAEGLDVEDGRHLLVAGDAERFAGACVRLLRDRRLAEALGEAGRVLVRDRYQVGHASAAVARIARRASGRDGEA